MSENVERRVNSLGDWAFKGIVSVCAVLVVVIFQGLKSDMKEADVRMDEKVKAVVNRVDKLADTFDQVKDLVVKHDTEIKHERDRHKDDVDRLDRQKADKR